jgi:hypothetical protein
MLDTGKLSVYGARVGNQRKESGMTSKKHNGTPTKRPSRAKPPKPKVEPINPLDKPTLHLQSQLIAGWRAQAIFVGGIAGLILLGFLLGVLARS